MNIEITAGEIVNDIFGSVALQYCDWQDLLRKSIDSYSSFSATSYSEYTGDDEYVNWYIEKSIFVDGIKCLTVKYESDGENDHDLTLEVHNVDLFERLVTVVFASIASISHKYIMSQYAKE